MREGVYLHIPFCVQKCPYCDFYSLPATPWAMDAFTEKTVSLIENCPIDIHPDTYYFGGGTPSLLGAKRLTALLQAVKKRFGEDVVEVTLEANPGTVTLEELCQLRKAGFNRISLGMQSGDGDELKLLGRIHSFGQSVEAYHHCVAAGFHNISLDLMMGLPNQTVEQSLSSAKELIALSPSHISAYLLKLEEGTPFSQRFTQNDQDQERQADIYTAVSQLLEQEGYHRYEISNFAKIGKQAIHNTKYWELADYLGIGPSAHSFIKGKRYFMSSDLSKYLQGETIPDLFCEDGEGGGYEEFVMLGLRMTKGISLAEVEQRYPHTGEKLYKRAEPMIKTGLMAYSQGRLSLCGDGFLLSNGILSKLLQ